MQIHFIFDDLTSLIKKIIELNISVVMYLGFFIGGFVIQKIGKLVNIKKNQ